MENALSYEEINSEIEEEINNKLKDEVEYGMSKTLNAYYILSRVGGLTYIPNFISEDLEKTLWTAINGERWLNDLKRRVQHYGYRYNYKSRHIDYTMKIGQLPNWSLSLAKSLKSQGFMSKVPDQLIINEYEPGQGIANHIDCEPCFENTVISLSLGSACVMDLINKNTKEKIELYLEPRSLVVLSNEARYDWTHGIKARKSDTFNNIKTKRNTRISLTFRNIILK